MNSAPHLLIEDRPEFERVLDEALRDADRHPELAAMGQRLNAEQLRTMALNASAAISACAAAEYQQFVTARDQLREPPPRREPSDAAASGASATPSASDASAAPAASRATSASSSAASSEDPATGETAVSAMDDTTGAGLVAILAVLAPVLAGTAALIFLLVGYGLRMVDPVPSIAQPMITAGWLFTVLTAAGILLAAVGLLITALRNDSAAEPDPVGRQRIEEVAQAREAWRQALLERGVLPFLREALADPAAPLTSATGSPAPHGPQPAGRTPQLGYSRPGFSTERDAPSTRPSFTSPDFTSPDYGGPEHPAE